MTTNSRSRVQAGVPAGGEFATEAREENGDLDDDLGFDDFPEDDTAEVTDEEVGLFTRGNCGIFAHVLASRNGWGVRVYGELDLSEAEDGYDLSTHDPKDPDSPYIGVEELRHAFAVRPDGKLVDVRGLHDPEEVAEDYANATCWDYASAAEADALWNHGQWLGDTGDFDFDFGSDEEELAHAAYVADLVVASIAES